MEIYLVSMATKITNKTFLFLLVFIFTPKLGPVAAPWEIGVIFLGANEPADYQKDIDKNILELARLTPNASLKLSIFRELPQWDTFYFADSASQKLHLWDPLFYDIDHHLQVPGQLWVLQKEASQKSALLNDKKLSSFLTHAFTTPQAHRILVLYSHGFAFDGLKNIKLKELRSQLEIHLPKRFGKKSLDILWLDACYMANLEVAYELRHLSPYFLASEESEFSSGMPFDALEELHSTTKNPKTVAQNLAERFLESYSFIKEGSQRKAVYASSATLSLIETEKLDDVVFSLSQLIQTAPLFPKELKKTLKTSHPLRKLSRGDLVDLGHLLLSLHKNKFTPPDSRPITKDLVNVFDLSQPKKFKTNPRILIRPEKERPFFVYGYESWTRGFETDSLILNKLPASLTPQIFVGGINNKAWPGQSLPHSLMLSPFSVGLQEFNFWFFDPQTQKFIGSPQSFIRTQDIVTFEAAHPKNPILFTGYTQGIGKSAERYSGLSILAPLQDAASLDYLDTEFSNLTQWAGF